MVDILKPLPPADSARFTYHHSWTDIERKLREAEKLQAHHLLCLARGKLGRSQRIEHMRNAKALEGVICSLRWALGDPTSDPLRGVIQ